MCRAEEDARRKTEEGVCLIQDVQQKSKDSQVKSEEVANLKAVLDAVEHTFDHSASIDDVRESDTSTPLKTARISMQSYLSGLER